MTKNNELQRLETLIETKKLDEDMKAMAFLESLKQGLLKYGTLTEKQSTALARIEKLSTPEAKVAAAEWIKQYPIKHRKNAIICAKYYLANTPYFSSLDKDIVNSPNFVPTKSQFDHLCTNPFAKKVLKEYYRAAAYDKGDLVQFRDSKALPFHLNAVKSKVCVVIDNSYDFITTHAAGAKTYKLLPIGRTTTLLCQERWIKNFRKKK